MNPHKFIRLEERGASRREAEQRVMECLQAAGVVHTKSALQRIGKGITLPGPAKGQTTAFSFSELVDAARVDGVVPILDHQLKARQQLSLSVSTDGEGAVLNLAFGSHKSARMLGPGFVGGDVVDHLLGDVCRLRRLVAENSAFTDSFASCALHWRTYLATCISALDAFISLGVWAHSEAGGFRADAPLLNARTPLEDRISQWHETFAELRLQKGQSWDQFQRLKRLRDEFVHPKQPTWTFMIQNAVESLNLCQLGVGQIMIDACKARGHWPSPALTALRFAPSARFVSKSPPRSP